MCATNVTPSLATERLLLRGPVRSDAARLCELWNDINVAGMTSALPHPFTPDAAETFVDRAQAQDWRTAATFALEHRQFGVVGTVGFTPGAHGRPELACWLGRPFWNRGYATEAVRAALSWVRRDWRKRVVVAGHFADNPAGGQALCKAGFLYTGDVELRDCPARGQKAPTRMMVWLA
jgi:RimJ/RimL family protein N-acetyltransferase